MISGILPVDKLQGWTSHDVVARVRRIAGQRQVGHAGTLDPLATGLLLVVLGRATRLSNYLMGGMKTYCAEVALGATTVTDDAEAPIAVQRDVAGITRKDVENCFATFNGEITQYPPAYAAVRHNGQKMYELARKGIDVEARPRTVYIHRIDVLDWLPPRVLIRVVCGSGTYVRALARDAGAALGTGGYLHALRRVRSGNFSLEGAWRVGDGNRETLLASLLSPDRAVLDAPAHILDDTVEERVRHGQHVSLAGARADLVRLYSYSGRFVGLGKSDGMFLHPTLLFTGDE